MREPTKQDFINTWGVSGYRESFNVYSMPQNGGVSEEQVVSAGLRPFYNKEHTCLEIGCGGGYWPEKHLCDNFKQVIGIDVVPTGGIKRGNFKFIEVPDRDYSCYGVADESVDFVWSFGVFCHLPIQAIAEYVKSAYRVLKPGGNACLYFSNIDRRPGTASSEQDIGHGIIWVWNTLNHSVKMMEDAGFSGVMDALPVMRDTMLIGGKR